MKCIAFIDGLKDEIKMLKEQLEQQRQTSEKDIKKVEFQLKAEQLQNEDIRKTKHLEIEKIKADYTQKIEDKDDGKK